MNIGYKISVAVTFYILSVDVDVSVKAKCSEEIASKKQEIAHLDSQIVHSPERTAQEMTTMEEKVCMLVLFGLRLNHVIHKHRSISSFDLIQYCTACVYVGFHW